jgi:Tol biopolymer transport system component
MKTRGTKEMLICPRSGQMTDRQIKDRFLMARKPPFLILSGLLIIAVTISISSCSGRLDQRPMATSTVPSESEPDLEPDPIPDPGGDEYPTIIPANSIRIPLTWASLELKGKLIYSLGALDKDNNLIVQIQSLGLMTGDLNVLYSAIRDGWIYYVSVSPDGKEVVMSYSPPLQSDPHVVQALYIMPLDHSQPPQLLLMPLTREDQYIQGEWSPDGKYIYYTYVNHLNPSDPNRLYPLYKIFRMKYPLVDGDQPELMAEEAYWPRLSSDGSHLVYVSLDPISGEQHVKIADADGRNVQNVILSGPYIPDDKTAPFFSPDDQSIIFSGNVAGESYQPNWFGKLMGIQAAKAESEPSDWFSVSVHGGEIVQLTHLQAPYLYGSFSPDKKHIVSYEGDELFVMNPDGSGLTVLISGLHSFYGTVSWLP